MSRFNVIFPGWGSHGWGFIAGSVYVRTELFHRHAHRVRIQNDNEAHNATSSSTTHGIFFMFYYFIIIYFDPDRPDRPTYLDRCARPPRIASAAGHRFIRAHAIARYPGIAGGWFPTEYFVCMLVVSQRQQRAIAIFRSSMI